MPLKMFESDIYMVTEARKSTPSQLQKLQIGLASRCSWCQKHPLQILLHGEQQQFGAIEHAVPAIDLIYYRNSPLVVEE
jgi:bacterioferritin-associated ferredoxin